MKTISEILAWKHYFCQINLALDCTVWSSRKTSLFKLNVGLQINQELPIIIIKNYVSTYILREITKDYIESI